MIIEKLSTKELFESFDEAASVFLKTISLFTEEEINTIPFKNSWTAAQVAEHVMQSNQSMIQSLSEKGRMGARNIDEGVSNLKKIFLNFDSKLQSPKFILPTKEKYNKEALIAELQDSIEKIKKLSVNVDVVEIINHPVFGEITKFEILHFIVYHTQRHTHQMKNIFQHLKK